MQTLSNVKILEQALAKARANNADWKLKSGHIC